jgi:hypothetical protein
MARTIRTAPLSPRDRDTRVTRRAVSRNDALRVALREQDVML